MTAYSGEYGGRLEAINKVLKVVADRSSPILSAFLDLSAAVEVFNYKYEWVDKPLKGLKDTVKTALTSTTTTTITMASTTLKPKRYIPNVTILTLGSELMLVTSVITTTTLETRLNVTRGYRSSTPATYAPGAIGFLQGPRAEGFTANRDDSQKGSRKYNHTRIIERQLDLADSSIEGLKTVGMENLLAAQRAELMGEMMKELNIAAIHSQRYLGATEDDHDMGGLNWFAVSGGGNNRSASGGAVSTGLLDDYIEAYANDGGDVTKMVMLLSYKQQRKFNELKEARVINGGVTQSDQRINNIVQYYDFNDKARIKLMLSTDLRDDEAYLFQEDNFKVVPRMGRQWDTKPLGKTGDKTSELLVGEYTCIYRNAPETLYRLYDLAVS